MFVYSISSAFMFILHSISDDSGNNNSKCKLWVETWFVCSVLSDAEHPERGSEDVGSHDPHALWIFFSAPDMLKHNIFFVLVTISVLKFKKNMICLTLCNLYRDLVWA